MKPLADDLYQLDGFPPNAVNIYLLGDILIDSGTRFDRRRILRQLRGRKVAAHALTHAHPDHQGSSRAVCDALGIPLWCSTLDAPAAEDPAEMFRRMPRHPINKVIAPRFSGPGTPVARRLNEGDEVGGFLVIATPGHTVGHVSYWREADRVLVLGDVLSNINIYTGWPSLNQPQTFFTADPVTNRASARKLAALEPSLVCFGHGPPLRDPAKLLRYVQELAG